jgi:hypothetical protein
LSELHWWLSILHTRLRHQCSSLNTDLSKIHIINSFKCNCGASFWRCYTLFSGMSLIPEQTFKILTLEESKKYKWKSEKVKKSEKLLTLALKSFWLIYKSSNFSKYFGVDEALLPSISRSFSPVYTLKLYSRLYPEALLPSISWSFTPIYVLKIYSRLYPEALLPQVIPTYMKSSPYKIYTWINDSKTKHRQ